MAAVVTAGCRSGREAARALLVSLSPLPKAPPVNVGFICERLGIEVYVQPADRLCAMMLPCRNMIFVNSDLPQGRFRFSIAHELGHYVLDHRRVSASDAFVYLTQERQAEAFAAELLMPEELLRRDLERCTFDQLVRRYRVSRQAMRIRIDEL